MINFYGIQNVRVFKETRIVIDHNPSLTVGSTIGSIRDLFAKVEAIDAKHGKFDLLICVGDFFGPASEENDDISQLLDGRLQGMLMSCTTYNILIGGQSTNRMLCYARRVSIAYCCC
jgi:hypothetical protein